MPRPLVVSLFAVVAAFVLHTAVALSQARPASVALAWSAPATCPSESTVLADVARVLRRPLDPTSPPAFRVLAEVTATPTGYHVVVRTESVDGVGQREIDNTGCDRLAEAVAVVVALAIDPNALNASPSPEPPIATASPSPSPPPSSAPVVIAPRGPALRFALAPMVFGDVGTLPQPGAGFGLSLALVFRSLVRVELWGSSWLPQDVAAGNGLPGGAHLEMLALAGLRGCLEHAFGRLELGGCVGSAGGALQGAGFGISQPATAYTVWLDASLAGTVAVRLADVFALRLVVEGALVLDQPGFTVQAYRGGDVADLPVYATSPVVARAALAGEFRF